MSFALPETMVSISSYDERPQSPFQRLANLREHKELRMKSFRRIPNYLSTLIEQFTENGFYYMGDGKNDKVQCAFCGIVISGWDATDDVTRQHLLLYPSCVHARSKCQVAAPEETKYCSDVKYIAYKGEEARHRSFKSWSCSSEDFPTVEALVQAGLFYTGNRFELKLLRTSVNHRYTRLPYFIKLSSFHMYLRTMP